MKISYLMLAHMEPDLKQQFENVEAYDMIESLKSMLQAQAEVSSLSSFAGLQAQTWRSTESACNQNGWLCAVDRLGFPISEEFATDIILSSLPSAYGQFISNYDMHVMHKKLTELHEMLQHAEANMKKGINQVLMVQNKAKFKKGSCTKNKAKSKVSKEADMVQSKASRTKLGCSADSLFFYCKEEGHWKMNCGKYLADKAKSGSMTSSSGTLPCNVIDLYLS
jgi:hypothetical protein